MADVSQYDDTITQAALNWNVDPRLLKAVLLHESQGDPGAVSKAGARGLMQIMPDTGRQLGMTDINDPVQNIWAGAKYLSQALDTEKTPQAALLYYHGGPDWRSKMGPESLGYVPAVAAQYRALAPKSPPPVQEAKASTGSMTDGSTSAVSTDDDILKLLKPAPGATTSAPGKAPEKPADGDGAAGDDDILKLLKPAPAATTKGAGPLPPPPPIDFANRQSGEQPDASELGLTLPQPNPPTAYDPAKHGHFDDSGGYVAPLDEYGRPLGQVPPTLQSGGGKRIVNAITEGWQGVPAIPRVPSDLVTAPIYNPLIAGLETTLRAGSAGFRGAQQTVAELGNALVPPTAGGQFGTALAGAMEAAPFLAQELPHVPTATPSVTPKFVSERFAPPPVPGQSPLERITQLIRHDEAERAANPLNPDQATREAAAKAPAAQAAQPDTTGLAGMGSGMAEAIGGNLRDMLWAKLEKGDTTELGQPSRVLIAAKQAQDQGVITDRASFDQFLTDWATQQRQQRASPQPQPQPVGAEATSAPIPPKTPGQAARDLHTMAEQTAEDRAQSVTKPGKTTPTLYDDTPYVTDIPGGTLPPRMMAERDFDPQVALDHKTSYMEDTNFRAAVDDLERRRNQGMTDLLKQDAGDKLLLEKAEEHRAEVSPKELRVFDNEQPVDPDLAQGFRDKVDSLLTGPDAKRGAIRSIIQDVRNSLDDAKGNLETQPSQWYGARKNITDYLRKGKGTGEVADNVRAVRQELTDMLPDIDQVIGSGAPKFGDFLSEWAGRSQRINQMEFLQQYLPTGSKSLYDKDGGLRFERLNAMIKDIARGRDAKGVNAAKSLTDEQIQNIENVRNELAAKSLRQKMEKVPGSPTAQLLEAMAKRGQGVVGKAFRTAGDLAAHSAAAYAASKGYPGFNQALSLYQTIGRPMREQRKLQRAQAANEATIAEMKRRLLSDEPVNPLARY